MSPFVRRGDINILKDDWWTQKNIKTKFDTVIRYLSVFLATSQKALTELANRIQYISQKIKSIKRRLMDSKKHEDEIDHFFIPSQFSIKKKVAIFKMLITCN